MFRVDDAKLIGRPENPPVFPVQYDFEVGGQTLVVPDEPVAVGSHRRLDVIPPVSLKFISDVQLFAPGSQHAVTIQLTAYRPDSGGSLKLIAPDGWQIVPESQPFHLGWIGEQANLTFTVTAPAQPATATITADATIGGSHFNNQPHRDSVQPSSVHPASASGPA